ncbi:MAG: hypothetical protein LRY54_02275 [Alphaproteobacteria bacterium]|nr:hypothetical protein [Alphaproteobacteria bacterium]
MDLKEIFADYAGFEVGMYEVREEIDFGDCRQRQPYVVIEARPSPETEALIEEMAQVAAQKGLTLRMSWPGFNPSAPRQGQTAVYGRIGKAKDGTWHIQNEFTLG